MGSPDCLGEKTGYGTDFDEIGIHDIGSRWDGIRYRKLLQPGIFQLCEAVAREERMCAGTVDIKCAFLFQRSHGIAERPARVNHIINDEHIFALDLTNDPSN